MQIIWAFQGRQKILEFWCHQKEIDSNMQFFILQSEWVLCSHSKLNLQVMKLNWHLIGKAYVRYFQLNLILSINIYWAPTRDYESHCAGIENGTYVYDLPKPYNSVEEIKHT